MKVGHEVKKSLRFHQLEYAWIGVKASGERVSGICLASDPDEVSAALMLDAIVPISIKKKSSWSRKMRISESDILAFMQQLCLLLEANFPLVEALSLLGEVGTRPLGGEHRALRLLVADLKRRVQAGASFSEVVTSYPHYFDAICCQFAAVGEQTGQLAPLLGRWIAYRQKMQRFRYKLKKMLTYPIMLLCTALLFAMGVCLFLLPEFERLLLELHAPLSASTRMMIAGARYVKADGIGILSVLILLTCFFLCIKKYYQPWSVGVDRAILHLPIIGHMSRSRALMLWSFIVAVSQEQGISLAKAVALGYPLIKNQYIKKCFATLPDNIWAGEALSHSLGALQLFSIQTLECIKAGEYASNLDKMLYRVSDVYRDRFEECCAYLGVCLERGIMVVLAVVVGGLIITIYWPILQMGSVI